MCVCVCVCESCLDTYISAATWPTQTKILGSALGNIFAVPNVIWVKFS